MNDQDLERDLQAQRGPREEGYAPTRLPATVGDALAASRRSMLPRAALLAGVALAGALAVAVVSGMLSGSDPGVGSTGTPSPSAEGSASVSGDCGPADVKLTAEPWGGAAGSRGTVVTLTLAAGRDGCTIGAAPAARITDASGRVLVTTNGGGAAGSVSLAPLAWYSVGIAWSNWCGPAPAMPVELSLYGDGWSSPVVVPVPAGGADPVPPCMGASTPSSLSATDLAPHQ